MASSSSPPTFRVMEDSVCRSSLIMTCPHCLEYVYVRRQELNCRIFRHGVYKQTFDPIHPHTPKSECERLVRENLIYGCGKPFEVVLDHQNQMIVQSCDYK